MGKRKIKISAESIKILRKSGAEWKEIALVAGVSRQRLDQILKAGVDNPKKL